MVLHLGHVKEYVLEERGMEDTQRLTGALLVGEGSERLLPRAHYDKVALQSVEHEEGAPCAPALTQMYEVLQCMMHVNIKILIYAIQTYVRVLISC